MKKIVTIIVLTLVVATMIIMSSIPATMAPQSAPTIWSLVKVPNEDSKAGLERSQA